MSKLNRGQTCIGWAVITWFDYGGGHVYRRLFVLTTDKPMCIRARTFGSELPYLRGRVYDRIRPMSNTYIHVCHCRSV